VNAHTGSKSGDSTTKSAQRTGNQPGDKPPVKILIMEDDQYYFRFVKRLLSQADEKEFEVAHAATLADCLEQLSDDTPDVVIIDLSLPDSSGLDTLARVSAVAAGAPMVVLTGSDDEEVGLKAVAMGAQDFLVKHQVSNDSLVRSIKYAIERRKSEEATLRMAAIRDFTSTLAHDLQTPLLAANSVVDGLLKSEFGELTQPMVRVISDLKENNNQQLQCVQKLLQVYKYETGQDLHFEKIELMPIIEQSCQDVATRFGKDKPIQIDVTKELPLLLADADAICTMFTNLIENAVKFGDSGKAVTVRVGVTRARISVDVHNDGLPIPMEGRKQLFQKFWQGVPGKWYTPHTGIGLYLCNRIVLLHRGRINCVSNPEDGTTVTVKLPAL
jgi:sigma-B regulation protein RsbU (phosphoserine phosphatase)